MDEKLEFSLNTNDSANTIYDRALNYIDKKYLIRFNKIALEHEITPINKGKWSTVNINSLLIELSRAGIEISLNKLEILLGSELITAYNPIINYFTNLPQWDGENHILNLCSFIETKDNNHFHYHFEKWLARVVLCACNNDYVNKQCMVFTSSQNVGKSTFLRFLMPKVLESHYMEDLSLNKDGIIAMCKNLIINLDELSVFSKYDINTLKSYMSRSTVNTRLPYAKKNQLLQRICSFVGSSNQTEFLTDTTGSVRWLIFELNKIDFRYRTDIDIDLVWAQSYYNAFHNKTFEPNLTALDIEENEKKNEKFREIPPEEEYLIQHFEKSDYTDDFRTTTEIAQVIMTNFGHNVTSEKLGRVLKQLGYNRIKHSKRQVYGYQIKSK